MAMINENVIQNWIIEENLFKEKIADNESNFHYVIEFPQGNIMDILQPKGKDDLLILVCGTMVSPEHTDLMKDATMKQREDFLFELRFSLNQSECDFQIDVNEELLLNQFVVQDAIFEDGLSKNELMKVIKGLFKAKMTCVLLMEKEFGAPTISESQTPDSNDNVMFM